ncbi:MAG: formylglycine-generating enzyme family protein, partial [bacterium]|nr:formylglycine-generating enzyme family protein [bacterium]
PVAADAPPAKAKVVGGAVLIERGVDMRLRGIPAGRFTMGSPANEAGRYDREGPQHEVRFAQGFWMGETEVTQGQWRKVMGNNPSYFDSCGDDCPVENVTWYEAVTFANKLSALAGFEECFELNGEEVTFKGPSCSGYRLPTEEEWEYAARAGTSAAYWSGGSESDLARVGWYAGNSDSKTHAVKGKAANAWGLHDVHGNVWEWTLSPRTDNYTGRDAGIDIAPLRSGAAATASGGVRRVIRGGGYGDTARNARSACRGTRNPVDRSRYQGFRVLLPVAPSS